MEQEDKQLLLKDLCARLPYRVKCKIVRDFWGGWNRLSLPPKEDVLDGKTYHFFATDKTFGATDEGVTSIIPYLRPMSSMTEEERREYDKLIAKCIYDPEAYFFDNYDRLYDWLLSHHFDYRSLIEKGLALEAPEDMYKTE